MSILSKEDFFTAVQNRIGTDSSDDAVKFMEDITDTYTDLVNRATGDGTDWKQKYEENDKAWAERYKARFFSGGNINIPNSNKEQEEQNEEEKGKNITINDLFN